MQEFIFDDSVSSKTSMPLLPTMTNFCSLKDSANWRRYGHQYQKEILYLSWWRRQFVREGSCCPCIYIGWFLTRKAQNNRYIMGCKWPEDIFFSANFTKTDSSGIDILQASDDPLWWFPWDGLQRLIMQDMPYENDFLFLFCEVNKDLAFIVLQCEWLFDKDMFAGIERFLRQQKMMNRRCCNYYSPYLRII